MLKSLIICFMLATTITLYKGETKNGLTYHGLKSGGAYYLFSWSPHECDRAYKLVPERHGSRVLRLPKKEYLLMEINSKYMILKEKI